MKKILVKYHIEILDDQIDKICKLARCGKRDLENDIKHMAEIAGRHRVFEFTQPFIQIKQEKESNEK
tara:strand:+ start:493 stop:693 length:201 start_codon:yes stop_codon:yes gene_type:complete